MRLRRAYERKGKEKKRGESEGIFDEGSTVSHTGDINFFFIIRVSVSEMDFWS